MSELQQIAGAIANGSFIVLVFFTIFGGIVAFIVYRQEQREKRRGSG